MQGISTSLAFPLKTWKGHGGGQVKVLIWAVWFCTCTTQNYFLQYDILYTTIYYIYKNCLLRDRIPQQFPPANHYYRIVMWFQKPTLPSQYGEWGKCKKWYLSYWRANRLFSGIKIKQINWWNFDSAEFGWTIWDWALIMLNVRKPCVCMVKNQS